MRTAESVLLICWPPAPEARKVSMRRSAGLRSTSPTSSASGITATVQAEVWMRPCASVSGTRCTRWPPDSNLSRDQAPVAGDAADDFLVAAKFRLVRRQYLDRPALALGEARVHAEKVAGEQRRLVTAGAGADFEDDALLVVGVARQQQLLQLDLEFGQARLGSRRSPRRRSRASRGRRASIRPRRDRSSAWRKALKRPITGSISARSRDSRVNCAMSPAASGADSMRSISSRRSTSRSSFRRMEGFMGDRRTGGRERPERAATRRNESGRDAQQRPAIRRAHCLRPG